jgi:hypothetical protein
MTDEKLKEQKSVEYNGTKLWTTTSNKESGAVDALRSASRTVAETCKNTHFVRDPNNKDRHSKRKRERT